MRQEAQLVTLQEMVLAGRDGGLLTIGLMEFSGNGNMASVCALISVFPKLGDAR